jgi:hypothetical protein
VRTGALKTTLVEGRGRARVAGEAVVLCAMAGGRKGGRREVGVNLTGGPGCR